MSWGVALRNAVGLGLGGIPSVLNAPPYASLNLNFLTGALDSRITFTRASGATYFNSAGVLSTAANNEARFDYDPATLAARGLLIEEQRTNLFLYSQQFDNAAWSKTNATVSQDIAISPDGTQNADAFIPNSGTAAKLIEQSVTTSSTNYAFSIFIKPNGVRYVQFRTAAAISAGFVNIDLQNGLVTTNTTWTATVSVVRNGWYRVVCDTKTVNAATAAVVIQIVDSGSAGRADTTSVGDGVIGVYLWGSQLEAGAFATSYIPTTTTALTRAADVASMTGANFSDWYNQVEGTLVAEFGPYENGGPSKNFGVVDINDGTSANIIRLFAGSTVSPVFAVTVGTVTQAYISSGTITPTNISKIAASYKADNFARSVNGAVAATDSSGTVPAVNRMLIGAGQIGVGELNGHLRSFAYYPKQLSASQLQSLTKLTPWTPSQITTALWLDAAEAGTITLNGSTVSQWNDKSGNGRNVSQATASAQPTYNATGLNGKPSLSFDGTSDFMLGVSNIGLSGNPLFSVAGVFVTQLPSDDVFLSFGSTAAASSYHFMGANSGNNVWTGFANASQLGTATLSSPSSAYVFTAVRNAVNTANWTVTQNGNVLTVTQGDSTAITLVDGPINIARFVNGGNIASMTAAEIVLVPTTLSTDNRQKLEGYLAWKWGLQANLPAGHPYKDAPPTV